VKDEAKIIQYNDDDNSNNNNNNNIQRMWNLNTRAIPVTAGAIRTIS
jgi:hypothetical protein